MIIPADCSNQSIDNAIPWTGRRLTVRTPPGSLIHSGNRREAGMLSGCMRRGNAGFLILRARP
jgi:hypothetical protein